ncbi:MAG: hypothetical protein H6577_27155 [Lewinellaceae bacterium]|nr:hypothetical protein [Saprospiraceae bacterium]MCB9341822.1 hypothetical protein [Lewinellaceae bacterium]
MKNLIYALTMLSLFNACQNSGTHANQADQATSTDTTAVAEETPIAQTSCYIRALGQDTTWVKLTITADGSVSGTYDWVPYEKDSARGTLTGKKESDELHLMYDYMIEGSNQQQEMRMKMMGDQIAEMEGELVEGDGGVLKLKDPTKVKYLPFTKVECK